MDVLDFWQILTNPQIWPLFLTFLGGYVMMNVFLGHSKLKKDFSELERILIAFGIGFLFVYFLFLPPVAMLNFWFPFLGENAYVISAILFCAVASSALFYAIYEERREKFIEAAKKILLGSIVPFSFLIVLILTVGFAALSWYPSYIVTLISYSWNSFMLLSLASFLMFTCGTFFLWIYVLKLRLRESFKDQTRRILKRRATIGASIVLIAVLVMGSLIVPLDKTFVLFTPHMQKGPESLSDEMAMGKGYEKVVFISVRRGPRDNISSTYEYYALMSTSYEITVPRFRLLSSLHISNPSNASFLMGEYYPSLPNAWEGWRKIWVAIPNNVTYKPNFREPPFASEVSGLTISFGNISGGSRFFANLTYWQEISFIKNVEIEYHNLTFADLGNGTWMETHTIEIRNNSNDTLDIPALEYDYFNFDCVIRNSTSVYFNGNVRPYAELVGPTRLALPVWAPAQMASNLTITFLTTENPE